MDQKIGPRLKHTKRILYPALSLAPSNINKNYENECILVYRCTRPSLITELKHIYIYKFQFSNFP